MKIFISIFFSIILISCSSAPRFYLRNPAKLEQQNKRVLHSHENKVDTLYNLSNSENIITGIASFYADAFDGKMTASGEIYNMYELTAAHRTFPFNTIIRVVNLDNNKTVIVRVNDRGPVPENRIIDLSLGAAIQLGMEKKGIQEVRLEVIEWGIK